MHSQLLHQVSIPQILTELNFFHYICLFRGWKHDLVYLWRSEDDLGRGGGGDMSLSAMWVPGIKLTLSGLEVNSFTHRGIFIGP